MKRIVADSSSLILLSKCHFWEIVCTQFEVVIPLSVSDETASDYLANIYPDASHIKNLISKGIIKAENPDPAEFDFPISLHEGEKDALLLALGSADTMLATDDGKAIKAAKFAKVPFIITPKLVVALFRIDKIAFKKARQSIEKLGTIGRYSPEIIAEAILSLLEVQNGKTHYNKDT